MAREYQLKALEAIKNEYDIIIIDCPPSLGLLTINALTAANAVVIPINVGIACARGSRTIIKYCASCSKTFKQS